MTLRPMAIGVRALPGDARQRLLALRPGLPLRRAAPLWPASAPRLSASCHPDARRAREHARSRRR
jgi:hypothetical protein